MKHLLNTALFALLLFSFSLEANAQKINQPKHIPNQFKNKINHIRLQGIAERQNAQDNVRETRKQHLDTNTFGFDKKMHVLTPGDGCNINIGNTASPGFGGSKPKDVIIAGDVINFCNK